MVVGFSVYSEPGWQVLISTKPSGSLKIGKEIKSSPTFHNRRCSQRVTERLRTGLAFGLNGSPLNDSLEPGVTMKPIGPWSFNSRTLRKMQHSLLGQWKLL